MKTIEQITHIAESLGWSVDVDESGITFSQYTTAGQDFSFTLIKTRILPKRFMTTTRVMTRQKRLFYGAPYHLKDIIADMEEAEAMVLKLYEAIKE